MRRIPSLTRLRTFEVAARLQSFALAADELSLTASAVSHQIRNLEEHFGRSLFDRRNRRVQTALEGQRLYQSLSRVFDALEAACAEVALPAHDEVLAVHCLAGIGRTGTILAAWLVSNGLTAQEALRRVRRIEPKFVQTTEQEEFLQQFEDALLRKLSA